MDWAWIVTPLGGLLVAVVLVDVFLSILHLDRDGPIASNVFHLVWRPIVAASRAAPRVRRSLIALAGPLIIAATFALWIGVFILGFALVYWPHLDRFVVDTPGAPGFLEALYFSGVTGTVLGYGDVTPATPVLKVVSFLQAALGFALLTGIITYLLSVVSSVAERNALAFRFWTATGRSGEGTQAVIRILRAEGSEGLLLRLHTLLPAMQGVLLTMHQFPVLDLFYRSESPEYAPELIVDTAVDLAVAARVAAAAPAHRRLGPAADELGYLASRLMNTVAAQHLDRGVRSRLASPSPGPREEDRVARVRSAIGDAFPELRLRGEEAEGGSEGRSVEDRLVELLFERRVFMEALEGLTGWRSESGGR